MAAGVRIHGLRELQAAFRKMGSELGKELQDELKIVAEPVRNEAVGLAQANISHIGGRWSQMRTGVTPSRVYVAPKARRRGGSARPNLGPLLMDRALEPALEAHEGEIVSQLETMLDRLGSRAGF